MKKFLIAAFAVIVAFTSASALSMFEDGVTVDSYVAKCGARLDTPENASVPCSDADYQSGMTKGNLGGDGISAEDSEEMLDWVLTDGENADTSAMWVGVTITEALSCAKAEEELLQDRQTLSCIPFPGITSGLVWTPEPAMVAGVNTPQVYKACFDGTALYGIRATTLEENLFEPAELWEAVKGLSGDGTCVPVQPEGPERPV